MPHIGVLFEVRSAETRPGELVSVVGSRPELSNWDPFDFKVAAGLQLRTGAKQYPCWAMSAPIWIQIPSGDGSMLSRDKDTSSWSDPESSDGSSPVSPYPTGTPQALFRSRTETAGAGGAVAGSEEPPSMRLEYKYVKDRRQLRDCGPSVQWEDCIANRRVNIPQEHGSIWIVSDQRFNEAGEPRITRTTLAEVLSRRGDLDPEWTFLQRDVNAPEWAGTHGEELSSPGSVETSSSHHTTSTVFFV
uniref:CBM20 domain-containing protein n=1 Tax=Alexandrium monilatum TaxID=311494 RepID=A0A7S4R3R5_9DINO|mmetsp:Transcript_81729/g.243717  ORF Transcript_81729/g.243717 Transcript_81729/m.243717 type:complete len:246 (+) Transcript_81729:83-820(+)